MLDYSIPIPAEYWNKIDQCGNLTDDSYAGK